MTIVVEKSAESKLWYSGPQERLLKKMRRLFSRLKEIPSSQRHKKIVRIEIEIPALQPLEWLDVQQGRGKVYWQSRDKSFEIAGLGKSHFITGEDPKQIGTALLNMHRLMGRSERISYLGGLRFDPSAEIGAEWKGFASYYFLLPQFEIRRDRQRHSFACNIFLSAQTNLWKRQNELEHALASISFEADYRPRQLPLCYKRFDNPVQEQWQKNIRTLLNSLQKNKLEKVVLARKTTFMLNRQPNALQLIKTFEKTKPNTFLFMFQLNEKQAFIGSAPERLYSRNYRAIDTEAVAGTRPRGTTVADDVRLKQDLLNSAKDLREHGYVIESIERQLSRYANLIKKDQHVSILENARVQHLRLGFQASLNKEVNDAQLLQSLHPTPAVGGYPKTEALQKIRALEGFDRGWYAAPVGWINKDKAEFAVAIRSALIQGNRLHLYSGAGIITGSDPQEEWREIENKISTYLKIIQWS